jgi:hypothetical protein
MQAPARLERDALADGECATFLATGQGQLLALGERADQKHQTFETDVRICHQVVVSLKGLAQQFTARGVGEGLLIDRGARAWQRTKQAAQTREQRAFLLVLRRTGEECALLR